MLFFIRTNKGLGGNTVYVRIKNNGGQYWDFSALSWVVTLNENCKVYLNEVDDGDPLESFYSNTAPIPAGGPWIEEAVDSTDNTVIAFDNNVMGELEAVPDTKSSMQEKIEFIFQYLANRRTATNTLETMHKDDGTILGTSDLSDDGTIFDKKKMQ